MNEPAAEIERKIEASVARWAMLPDGCSVVVGLSGGADSVALTHFLLRYSRAHGIRVTAAHVNHGLRGARADADERFVREFCARRGVELRVLRADVRALAAEKSRGIEECGREVRYSFFRSLCGPGGRIATAHTLSDSVETVLMNLARGAGPRGLCGVPPVRGNVVRPLSGITRAEVERYCSSFGLPFVTDATNFTADCARNKIRLQAVPVLRGINPALEECVLRTMRLLRDDEDYLEGEAEKRLAAARLPGGGYGLAAFRAAPRPVASRMVRQALGGPAGPRESFRNIAAVADLIARGKGSVTAAGGIQCTVCGNTLFVTPPGAGVPAGWRVPLDPSGTRLPDGRVLTVRPVRLPAGENRPKVHNLMFHNLINYDTIFCTGGFIRGRRAGDRFEPAGRGVTKTLRKLFNEAKIPPPRRDSVAIVEAGGEIAWVEGFGPSQGACPPETGAAAQIIIQG